jgi:tRNA dimethylallyltransferase
MSRPKIIAVVGPTASGKTNLALTLAKLLNGEVISADSRQIYKGFVIGAGVIKGEWQERDGQKTYIADGIPHWQIGIADPAQTYTLAEYKSHTERIIADILARGKVPILCGGTGLYISAVLYNFQAPNVSPNPELRKQLDACQTTDLFEELRAKDPDYAARITPQNRRYIIRALEVIAETGKPFSSTQHQNTSPYDVLQIGIDCPNDQLKKNITVRVDGQFSDGLEIEVRELAQKYGWDVPAMTGLGYRQLKLYIEGVITESECKAKIVRETWQFAKRQRTWFKRDKTIHWVASNEEALTIAIGFAQGVSPN